MADELKKTYLALLVPAIVALLLACGVRWMGLIPHYPDLPLGFVAPTVFVLAVVLAVAAPIFIRSLFAHRMRNHKAVPQPAWMQFERRLIVVSLMAPYLVAPAVLLDFPDFYFVGVVLMALYAAYYFYPSQKRIRFERRIFRVK